MELVRFEWHVCQAGYEWTRGCISPEDEEEMNESPEVLFGGYVPSEEDRLVLTDYGARERRMDGMTAYNPLEEYTGLHRVFADLKPRPEDILDFANRYGMLGPPITCSMWLEPSIDVLIHKSAEQMSTRDAEKMEALLYPDGQYGESFRGWQREISVMNTAVQLWDALRTKDSAKVTDLVAKTEHEPFAYDVFCDSRQRDWTRLNTIHNHRLGGDPDLTAFLASSDVATKACGYVKYIVNYQLSTLVGPRLDENRRTGDLEMCWVPTGLLGAMWLQFAISIAAKKEYTRCRTCLLPYEVHPESARTNKRFCSNACRTKSYRDRQNMAQHMHREGIHLEQIAVELHTNVETARGWLELKRGRRPKST